MSRYHLSRPVDLAVRAERIPVQDLGRAGHDRRDAETFAAALAAETEASLRRDPQRWPWPTSLIRHREGAQ